MIKAGEAVECKIKGVLQVRLDGLLAQWHWLVSVAEAHPYADPGHKGGLWHIGQAAARHLALAREMKT